MVGNTTRDFVYDGLNLVQEKQGNQVKANVVPGLGLDEVFTRLEGNTARQFLMDALGSTVALTDANGAVQGTTTALPREDQVKSLQLMPADLQRQLQSLLSQ